MAVGGITFGVAKPILAGVVENGVDPSDPRVMYRTNEAVSAILDEGVWVNGCMTVDIQAEGVNGDELFLPKELENAIEAEVIGATVNGSSDVTRGFYDIVNQFAYADPSAAGDNPLVDLFLQPDPNDASILRRKYRYPGLSPNATVRVTGAKRYVPITQDGDYLIVQNLLAIKDMIQSIWRKENNDPQGSEILHKACMERLQAEVKKHQLDPRNAMRRKAEYYKDLETFPEHTFGWMRANLALEVPSLMNRGKLDISFVLNMAEKRLMQRGLWKDCIQEYTMQVVGGEVAFPKEVQSVLAVDMNGCPIPIRSVFFEYLENGPGMSTLDLTQIPSPWIRGAGHAMLVDQGDEDFQGGRRRVYKLVAPTAQNQTITAACKLRWVERKPTDQLAIKNFEALRNMIQCIMNEENEKYQEAQAAEAAAFRVLEQEQQEYLDGIRHVVHIQAAGFGLGNVGTI
jgi:hypothetical protein